MSAIVHRKSTPVCFTHAAQLADMDPCWGVHPISDAGIALPDTYVPPTPRTLETMQAELNNALVPCGMAAAAKAAAVLIAAYPQADNTSAAYAQHVAKRLAECPADLLDHVVDRIIDSSPDFRPAPGRVADAVRREVAKRSLLLRRVQAAMRWWHRQDAQSRLAAEIQADKQRAAELVAETGRAVHVRPGDTIIAHGPQPVIDLPTGQLRIGPREAPLQGDALAAARRAAGIPTPAKPQTDGPLVG
jgi:hypothetical protein